MIVVDTNVLAYLFIEGERTAEAESVLGKDLDWAAPYLWRSEFRNILALYIRQGHLSLVNASAINREAEILMAGGEYEIEAETVLRLAEASKCSAYDCEFAALAQVLKVSLVTSDKKILAAFPETAVSMDRFGLLSGEL